MKILAASKTFLALLFTLFLLSSCKKDSNKKNFQIRTKTWYRVSPAAPMEVIVNGVKKIGFAYFPGAGSGEATFLGNGSVYFNQLVYSTTGNLPPEGSVAAPVSAVPAYPLTGGPLPLIQPGDFTTLGAIVTGLNLTPATNSQVINSIMVNKAGDAIFTSAITGSGSTYPISAVLVGFNGKATIVGGRGRFVHAKGEIKYEGYFNVLNPDVATYNADGWIDF
ncbi:MAG: hypothetical protein WKF89_03450 [Chitinophagaceae bacterium]